MMGERNYLELPFTGEIKINYLNIKDYKYSYIA